MEAHSKSWPAEFVRSGRFEKRPNSGRFTNRPYGWRIEMLGFETGCVHWPFPAISAVSAVRELLISWVNLPLVHEGLHCR